MVTYLSFCAILEVCRCLIELLHQRPLLDALGPLKPHGLVAVGYDDVLGPVLEDLNGNVLGRVTRPDHQQPPALELCSISEVVGVHDSPC